MVTVPAGGEGSSSASFESDEDGLEGGSILDGESRHEFLSFSDNMRHVAAHYKSIGSQISELWRLAFGSGKISPDEYYAAHLYADDHDFGEKSLFAGDKKRLDLWRRANYNPYFHGMLWSKVAFYVLMRGAGIPVPETLGLYSPRRFMTAYRVLRTHDDVREFLSESPAIFPLFGKPSEALQSLNITCISFYDSASDVVTLYDGRVVSFTDFMDAIDEGISDQGIGGDNSYLFQKCLKSHPDLRSMIGETPASVRIITLNDGDGARIFRAVWKLPLGGNIADNFWRGNALASINIESGVIERVMMGTGLSMRVLTDHPETGHRLVGAPMPGWDVLRDMCLCAAGVLPEVPIVGWDSVWSDGGGVLLEGNVSPDVWLLQFASDRGILGSETDGLQSYSARRLKNLRGYMKRVSRNYKRSVWARSVPKLGSEINTVQASSKSRDEA